MVMESARVVVPMAFGLRRPTVLVPRGFAEQYSAKQRRTVLAHELAHVAHGDPWWMLAASVMVVLLWWHPAVWYLRKRLQRSNELAADQAVHLVPEGPAILAQLLVRFARDALAARRRTPAAAAESVTGRSALAGRVQNLLRPKGDDLPNVPLRNRRWVVSIGAISIAFSVVTSTGWIRSQPPLVEGGPSMRGLDRVWLKSLAGLAVVGCLSLLGDTPSGDGALAPSIAAAEQEQPQVQRDRQARREGERREAQRRDVERRQPGRREEPRAGRPPEAERGRDRSPKALERERQEILATMERLEARLREAGEEHPQEAEEIRGTLERLQQRLKDVSELLQRAGVAEAEARRREVEARAHRQRAEAMARARQVLERQAEELRHRLEQVAREHPDQAEQIERRLREIHERLEQLGRAARPSPLSRPSAWNVVWPNFASCSPMLNEKAWKIAPNSSGGKSLS